MCREYWNQKETRETNFLARKADVESKSIKFSKTIATPVTDKQST